MLRDRFVCGISDHQIQRRLLALKDPVTFEDVSIEALGQETTTSNYQTVEILGRANAGAVNKLYCKFKKHNDPILSRVTSRTDCYRCGSQGNLRSDCHFKTAKCH